MNSHLSTDRNVLNIFQYEDHIMCLFFSYLDANMNSSTANHQHVEIKVNERDAMTSERLNHNRNRLLKCAFLLD